ncbi:MAG: hypothetical protein ACYDDV_12495 [Methanoregula sp.]
MKHDRLSVAFSTLIVVLLVITCGFSGCTSSAPSVQSTPTPTVVKDISVVPTSLPSQPGVSPSITPTQQDSKIRYVDRNDEGTVVPPVAASLSNGVTVTYPSDWEKVIPEMTLSKRDYGRETYNIANFYSPDILVLSKRWNQSQPNVDKSKYTVMSIDVDPVEVTDYERYFNLATVDLQKYYGSIDITKHDFNQKISGYKAYRLDFDTATAMRGSYIFTNVDGTMYIFVFKNPSLYSAEIDDLLDTIKIVSKKSTQKTR